MPCIVKTLISLALVGPSAGIEDDGCLLGDQGCSVTLLQIHNVRSQRTPASIPVSSVDPMKTDHNLTVHDERDAQALQEVLEKAKQARDAAAEKVRLAEQAVEKANLQAVQRSRQAEEVRAKASKDLQEAKAAQAEAAKAMKSTEGRADRAFHLADDRKNSRETTRGDLQEVSNATTATVVEAEDAEEKAKAAADAAATAVTSEGDASASGAKAREAEAARVNKLARADAARKHEASVRRHSRPAAVEDDWAWQENMEHADAKPIGWEGDYLVDSNNPLEPAAWGMKNRKQPMTTAIKKIVDAIKNDAIKKTTETKVQMTAGDEEVQQSPPQNLDDVVAKTKLADEKAIAAAAMAKDAANQSKVVLQKAQQVSDAAIEELEKARAAEAAAKDAAAAAAGHATKEVQPQEVDAAPFHADRFATTDAGAEPTTDTGVEPTTQKRVVRGTLVKDENSLHRIGWRIPDERTETGNMEVDHSNPQDLYNWKPYPKSDGQ